jgi:hypothetical protein
MALLNDSGTEKYWFNGLPAEGALLEANDAGTVKYWFNGLPAEWVNPTAGGAPATLVKDIIENTGILATPR